MKKLLSLLLIIFFCPVFSQTNAFAKKNKKGVLAKVITQKPESYFDLIELLDPLKLSKEESLNFYDESVNASYLLGQIYALNTVGRHYRIQSNYKTALKKHNKALQIARKNRDTESKIVTLNLLGVCYRRINDLRSALDNHQHSLSLANKIEPQTNRTLKSISISENSIGNIYISLKQYKLAIEELTKSLNKKIKLNDTRGIAISHDNIGYANEKLGNLDKAIESYKKSKYFNEQINSQLGKVICHNRIAGILIQKERYNKALQYIKEAEKDLKELDNKYYTSETLSNLGWAYLKKKDYKKAEKNLLEAIRLSQEYDLNSDYFVKSCIHLSKLYEEKQEFEKAFFYYKEGKEQEKRTTGEQNILYVNNIISKYNVQAKENEINKLRAKTQLSSFENSRNRNVLIITLVSLALLSVALYSIYRQRLLNNDRRVLMLEQQALQAQMNPHFIFNALNSIKLYIINNEQKNAVYYLNKFSKLIRNILDVSKVKEVSLGEELKTMDLYMSIENIRFNNEITYEQKISSNLNLDTIKLPPLVLQPFLENAIWHGLSSKQEGDKHVVLSAFQVSKNLIEISITDNGVGRDVAMQIKKEKNASLKRKSIGIDLTKERLKTFASDFMHDFSLKYYDLKDDDEKPLGTKVALRIPVR